MKISQFREFIKDFKAYNEYKKNIILTLFNINVYVNLNYRLSHMFFNYKLFPIAKIFWLINRLIFSIDIDPGAHLSGGFLIIHGFGIVIGRNVKTLGPVKIYHGVTLGGNNNKEKAIIVNDKKLSINQPLIYPNTIIGINSSILGPVVIEENAIIGTGAIVTRNVPKNSLCVGINKIKRK